MLPEYLYNQVLNVLLFFIAYLMNIIIYDLTLYNIILFIKKIYYLAVILVYLRVAIHFVTINVS